MVNCTAVIAKPKYASAVLEIASAGAAGNDKAPATTDANPAKSLYVPLISYFLFPVSFT